MKDIIEFLLELLFWYYLGYYSAYFTIKLVLSIVCFIQDYKEYHSSYKIRPTHIPQSKSYYRHEPFWDTYNQLSPDEEEFIDKYQKNEVIQKAISSCDELEIIDETKFTNQNKLNE